MRRYVVKAARLALMGAFGVLIGRLCASTERWAIGQQMGVPEWLVFVAIGAVAICLVMAASKQLNRLERTILRDDRQ